MGPQNGWVYKGNPMKPLLKWMIWGYPYFWKHPHGRNGDLYRPPPKKKVVAGEVSIAHSWLAVAKNNIFLLKSRPHLLVLYQVELQIWLIFYLADI